VEDLIPPSFFGASFLSTHGFLRMMSCYLLAGMSRLTHWLAASILLSQN
jgi:hypothetical protein